MTSQSGGPTALRILLGSELRRLREARGISPSRAASAIHGSESKISRMELGRHAFKEVDIAGLLTLYGVTDHAEREQLLALTRRANQPGWWHSYSDILPHWFQAYIGLEEAASHIRTYEPQFVPGLLQTEEYAAAVIALGDFPPEEAERRVSLRKARQRRFRDGDLHLWAIIDEAVLRRPVGGTDAMRDQLRYLRTAAQWPNVALQVTSLQAGGHAAPVAFSILRFPDRRLPDIVYVEQLTSALYLDKQTDVAQYVLAGEHLGVVSERPKESIKIIGRLQTPRLSCGPPRNEVGDGPHGEADLTPSGWAETAMNDGVAGPGTKRPAIPAIDASVAHPARIYDYLLGGKDNFRADRATGDGVLRAAPEARDLARENRAFLGRAVRYVARAGVRQFLDIGTGLPAHGNTNEVAHKVAPDARIVYVDNDPIVLAHADAILAGHDEGRTTVIQADLREPEKILNHPDLTAVLDLSRPTAILLVAILHFIADAQDPAGIVTRLKQAMTPGSYLIVSHVTQDLRPDPAAGLVQAYRASSPAVTRTHAEVLNYFNGLELVDPGLVPVPSWRPDGALPPNADSIWVYGGVGHLSAGQGAPP